MIELKPREMPSGQDPDGVRIVRSQGSGWRTTLIWQALALFLTAGCVGYIVMPRQKSQAPPADREEEARKQAARAGDFVIPPSAESPGDPADPAATATAATAAAGGSGATSQRQAAAARKLTAKPAARSAEEKEDEALRNDPNEVASVFGNTPPPQDLTAGEYIQALHDAGIYTGIGAFNPPGTSPPLDGLVVPEGYELPEGYVAHYQTTDEGKAIDPILMFSPDFDFFDENGNPIPIPEDRVVPPELAPPGFPIEHVKIPTGKREPGDTAR